MNVESSTTVSMTPLMSYGRLGSFGTRVPNSSQSLKDHLLGQTGVVSNLCCQGDREYVIGQLKCMLLILSHQASNSTPAGMSLAPPRSDSSNSPEAISVSTTDCA